MYTNICMYINLTEICISNPMDKLFSYVRNIIHTLYHVCQVKRKVTYYTLMILQLKNNIMFNLIIGNNQ